MNKLVIVILIALALTGCSKKEITKGSNSIKQAETKIESTIEPTIETTIEPKKQPTEQEIALRKSEVKAKFIEKFGIEATIVAEPLMYDITNDGSEDIILSTFKQYDDGLSNYYIGIYSLQDGSEMFAEQYEAGDELIVTPISNPTYRNVIAVIELYAGASAIHYEAEVIGLHNNELQSIFSIEDEDIEIGDPSLESIISDVDGDGFQEFKGFKYDYGPGSDRLSRANGIVERVVFAWNESKKSYESALYGEDDIADEQRIPTGEISKDKALQLVQAARKLQLDWMMPIETEESVIELMRPFFSNNFIKEFLEDGAIFYEEYNGYLQRYTETGSLDWVLPDYTDDADIKKSEDGIYAYLVQDIEQGYEGETIMLQATTILVKTKYGWKIDRLTFQGQDEEIDVNDHQGFESNNESLMEDLCGQAGCNASP